MRRISDQRIAIGQSAGKSGRTEPLIVLPHDRPITSNLDDAIVVLVTNEDVTVGKQFGTIGVVERARDGLRALEPAIPLTEPVYSIAPMVALSNTRTITIGKWDA